jgi:hypothetical protein
MKFFDVLKNGTDRIKQSSIRIDEDCNYAYSSSTGVICAMNELSDPVFSDGMMGETIGIWLKWRLPMRWLAGR